MAVETNTSDYLQHPGESSVPVFYTFM